MLNDLKVEYVAVETKSSMHVLDVEDEERVSCIHALVYILTTEYTKEFWYWEVQNLGRSYGGGPVSPIFVLLVVT